MPHSEAEGVPWQQLLAISYGSLGLAPTVFWAMTPCEWVAILAQYKADHGIAVGGWEIAITRGELCTLMDLFPDIRESRIPE